MLNYKLTLSYDGREYFGWQRHGQKATIQGTLERALAAVFGRPCTVSGAGRTDRGAHAEGQVASVLLPEQLESGEATSCDSLRRALNGALPDDIEIREIALRDGAFHARTSATGKRYRYEIYCGETCPAELVGRVWHVRTALDVAPMQRACGVLLGKHDFASFATRSNFKAKSTVRELRMLILEDASPRLRFVLEADSFLYKMVRNLVRALVKIGEGRANEEKLAQILAARDRRAAPGTAPASGLYLDRVYYEEIDGTGESSSRAGGPSH